MPLHIMALRLVLVTYCDDFVFPETHRCACERLDKVAKHALLLMNPGIALHRKLSSGFFF